MTRLVSSIILLSSCLLTRPCPLSRRRTLYTSFVQSWSKPSHCLSSLELVGRVDECFVKRHGSDVNALPSNIVTNGPDMKRFQSLPTDSPTITATTRLSTRSVVSNARSVLYSKHDYPSGDTILHYTTLHYTTCCSSSSSLIYKSLERIFATTTISA